MGEVIGLYLVCLFHYILRRNTPEAAAFRSIIQRHSYRLTSQDKRHPLIGLRYLRIALGYVWTRNRRPKNYALKSSAAIFDGHITSAEVRLSYLTKIAGGEFKFVLAKNANWYRLTLLGKINYTLWLLLIGMFVIPVTLVHPNRAGIAMNLMELVENAFAIRHARDQKIKKVYYFCGYEKDANFGALLLMRNAIRCFKIPSSNPIKNFYKVTIADKFYFTAPFQRAEFERLKTNWFADEVEEWPVFGFDKLLPLIESRKPAEKNTLGFISSGVWLRKKRGDLGLGVGEEQSEPMLIELIKAYMAKHPEVRLSIFFHPIEKKSPGQYEETVKHFTKIFGLNCNFFPIKTSSNTVFERVEVSIAAHSSSNLERLFMGMKTLYAPLCYSPDLFEDDPINNIAAFQPERVEQLLNMAFALNEEDFFKQNCLEHYHHSFYNSLIG